METPKQCSSCKHYDDNYDPEVGYYGQPSCSAVRIDGNFTDNEEQLAVVLERVLFALSDINNCPMWEKQEPRRSILNVKREGVA